MSGALHVFVATVYVYGALAVSWWLRGCVTSCTDAIFYVPAVLASEKVE